MRYTSKKFLSSSPDETGTLIVKIETQRVRDMTEWSIKNPSMSASLIFRACYGEPVAIDFDIGSHKSLSKRNEKIDLIIDELVAFKKQMNEAWNSYSRDLKFKAKELGVKVKDHD